MADRDEPHYHHDFDTDEVVDQYGNPPPPVDCDEFLYSMATFMLQAGEREEVRLLLSCELEAREEEDDWHNEYLVLTFSGPRAAYDALANTSSRAHEVFKHAADAVQRGYHWVNVEARAQLAAPTGEWRKELLAILDGRAVDNQAVGFDAPKVYAGLRFRSESEVRVARALDLMGVMYVPNCKARLGHPEDRKTREPDFLIVLNGRAGVLEVDGEPFHPPTRTVHDHERDRMFKAQGIAVVEHYDATRCYNQPDRVAAEFLELLKQA